jgi:hypothetical protein
MSIQPDGLDTLRTPSGVTLYQNWRSAVKIDPDLPAIRAKADPSRCDPKDLFRNGHPKICSQHSEDRLTWIFFRSLERSARTREFIQFCFPDWLRVHQQEVLQTLYWHRPAQNADIDPDIYQALGILEPYQRSHPQKSQHTETDAAVKMSASRIMVEAKLGKHGGRTGWERYTNNKLVRVPRQYQEHAIRLLKCPERGDWERITYEFYQPIRNLMLASIIAKGDLSRVGLLLIVNGKTKTPERDMYDQAFLRLTRALLVPENQMALFSWHDLASWAKPMGPDLRLAADELEVNPLLRVCAP